MKDLTADDTDQHRIGMRAETSRPDDQRKISGEVGPCTISRLLSAPLYDTVVYKQRYRVAKLPAPRPVAARRSGPPRRSRGKFFENRKSR